MLFDQIIQRDNRARGNILVHDIASTTHQNNVGKIAAGQHQIQLLDRIARRLLDLDGDARFLRYHFSDRIRKGIPVFWSNQVNVIGALLSVSVPLSPPDAAFWLPPQAESVVITSAAARINFSFFIP